MHKAAGGGQHLGNARAGCLQVAAVGEGQEQGGVHQKEQHERVPYTRQQQLPSLPLKLGCGGVGCVCEHRLC